jgi:hypothetical protein
MEKWFEPQRSLNHNAAKLPSFQPACQHLSEAFWSILKSAVSFRWRATGSMLAAVRWHRSGRYA